MVNFFAKKEPSADAPKKAPNFRSYVDPTHEFESKDLAREMWFVRHEVTLYKIFFWFMAAVAIVTWSFTLYKAANYIIFGIVENNKLDQSATHFIDYTPLKIAYKPKDLSVQSTFLIPSGTNKTDAIAEVVNPNDRWMLIFDYRLNTGGPSSTVRKAVVLPQQTTLLTSLGLDEFASDPTLEISNLKWSRVSNHIVPDMTKFLNEHLNFEVSNFLFSLGGKEPLQTSGARVTFTLTNNTAFSYSHPSFIVGLYKNQGLVGVVPLKLDSFKSLQAQNVDLRVFTPNLNVDSVVVYPQINIFDPESFVTPAK